MIDFPGPPTDTRGSLHRAGEVGVVRIEQRYALAPDDIWPAFTDPERVAEWYGRISGDLREGGQIHVRIDGPDIDAVGRVEECRRPSLLRVQTRETEQSARKADGQPFDQTIVVTLEPVDDFTIVILEISGLPLAKIAAYGVGWQLHAEQLSSGLTARPSPDIATRWSELTGRYDKLAHELR